MTSARTAFDHVAVAYSMVMSLSAVRLLDGLRPALAPRAGSWVAATWMLHKLLGVAFSWWAFYWLRADVTWTVATFLWVLLAPGILCLQATALVTTHPGSIADWRAHFGDIRRWFFSLEVAFVTHSVISATMLRHVPATDPLRLIQAIALGSALVGVTSARRQWHGVLAPAALGTQLVGLAYSYYRP